MEVERQTQGSIANRADPFRRALALLLCLLTASGCTTGPFASNRPMGVETPGGCGICPGGHLPKPSFPKICKPKPAVPVVPAPVPGMRIMPSRLVAPVGSEVVVLAGLCEENGHYATHERIEWSLDGGSVGQFIVPGQRNFPHNIHNIEGGAERISPIYAVGRSTRHQQTLTRGTETPADDVFVKSGQGWTVVTAATEGTSHITAYAPREKAWTQHRNTATIHWVDSAWQFPPPAAAPLGERRALTTTVMRNTDRSPIAGWVVRYEVASGPAAGFGQNLDPAVEVTTDAAGQATVDIAQRGAAPGTNQINIQVIRPADPASGIQSRIALGAGGTTIAWGTASLSSAPATPLPNTPAPNTPPANAGLTIRGGGPSQVAAGGLAAYTFDVTNTSGVAIRGISVSALVPSLLTYQSSDPPPAVGQTLVWQLNDLGANESRRISINTIARATGAVQFCADALISGQKVASDCVTTTVGADQPLVVAVQPEQNRQYRVGEEVRFQISIANRGSVPLTGLQLRDTFEPGFTHPEDQGQRRIVLPLNETLPAGQTRAPLGLTFRVVRPGRVCHTVEVTAAGGHRATATACIDAVGAAEPPANQPGTVSAQLTGPGSIALNEPGVYLVEVTNTSPTALVNVDVVADFKENSIAAGNLMGFTNVGGQAVWRIDRMEPGQKYQRQIQLIGRAADPSAFVGVLVTSAGQRIGSGRTSVAVGGTGAPALGGNLKLNITSNSNPARVGAEITYVINIENDGRGEENDVVVEVNIPPGMTLVQDPPGVQLKQDRLIRFQPIPVLSPVQAASIQLKLRAASANQYDLSASATSRTTRTPVTDKETTTVQAR